MDREPVYPLIIVYENSFPMIVEAGELEKATIMAILKQQNNEAFDCNGNKWSYQLVSEKVRPNFFTKLLAYTFYNPWVETKPIWTKLGTYSSSQLKEILSYCVDQDDDVLTQFVEPEDLKNAFDKASNFNELHKALEKYVYQVDEDEIEKEFGVED